MTSDKIRVGIVGVGFYTLRVHVPALLRSKRAELTAVSRRNAEHLESIRQGLTTPRAYTDWRVMLDHEPLDALIVATPHAHHAAPTLAALERGLHVLVEKPLASTLSDACVMCDAASKAGKLLMVGYQSRHLALYRTIKRALGDGIVGAVRQVQVTVAQPTTYVGAKSPAEVRSYLESLGMPDWFINSGIYAGDWRGDVEVAGGGMLADTGSHYIDLALWLAGARVSHVSAFREPQASPQETHMTVQIRLKDGCLVSITLNARTPRYVHWTILGDDGTLTTDGRKAWVHRGQNADELPVQGESQTMVDVFVSAILDGKSDATLPDEAAHVVEVTEAAYASARNGRSVAL